MEKDRFGINMIQYGHEHEAEIEAGLTAHEDPAALLAWHEQKLAWLQHERLIHLLVTIWTSLAALFFGWLFIDGISGLGGGLLLMGLLILLGFYLVHYFRLENMVQHWYRIAERIRSAR